MTDRQILRIGTRKSPLALAQTGQVADALRRMHPGLEIEIVALTTSGDRLQEGKLMEFGGKGLFTKELEEALLDQRIDVAVHSVKDMPTVSHNRLTLVCTPEREDARDVLISRNGADTLARLPKGAMVGTASLRRAAQILWQRPDLKIVTFRGNVGTRLKKIQSGQADATLLALAGLKRLNLNPLPGHILDEADMLPAVGQGALGLECRKDDTLTQERLAPLNDQNTNACITAEREMLRLLDGSCRTPIAGHAIVKTNHCLHLTGRLLPEDGNSCTEYSMEGGVEEAAKLGREVGEAIRALHNS